MNILSFSTFCTVFMLNILFLVISFFFFVANLRLFLFIFHSFSLTNCNEHSTIHSNFSFCLTMRLNLLISFYSSQKNARNSLDLIEFRKIGASWFIFSIIKLIIFPTLSHYYVMTCSMEKNDNWMERDLFSGQTMKTVNLKWDHSKMFHSIGSLSFSWLDKKRWEAAGFR